MPRMRTNDDSAQGVRTCAYCGRPLPSGSRPRRRFCSSGCRLRAWDKANPAPGPEPSRSDLLFSADNPFHYHGHCLVGVRDRSIPWLGKQCPVQCPGLEPGERLRPAELYHREVAHMHVDGVLCQPGCTGGADGGLLAGWFAGGAEVTTSARCGPPDRTPALKLTQGRARLYRDWRYGRADRWGHREGARPDARA
jgi:hypothetical protein